PCPPPAGPLAVPPPATLAPGPPRPPPRGPARLSQLFPPFSLFSPSSLINPPADTASRRSTASAAASAWAGRRHAHIHSFRGTPARRGPTGLRSRKRCRSSARSLAVP